MFSTLYALTVLFGICSLGYILTLEMFLYRFGRFSVIHFILLCSITYCTIYNSRTHDGR